MATALISLQIGNFDQWKLSTGLTKRRYRHMLDSVMAQRPVPRPVPHCVRLAQSPIVSSNRPMLRLASMRILCASTAQVRSVWGVVHLWDLGDRAAKGQALFPPASTLRARLAKGWAWQ